jgi:hypothetical protein
MATSKKPDLVGTTKPNNETGVTDVKTVAQRKVTYLFKATSSANLSIPYAAAVNGKALAAYATIPARVSGANGKIVLTVDEGSKVTLYLNSDAAAAWRANPLYAVTVGERDVLVKVTEKPGLLKDADTPVLKAVDPAAKAPPMVDEYAAPLTGAIWMKASHVYTAAEVDAYMPAGTSAEVLAAVKSIYSGLSKKSLSIAVPAKADKPAFTLAVDFQDEPNSNPNKNIPGFNVLTDGLPRAHPAGYAALFNAAVENSITALTLTSCWRPLLGSIAHRAGLGLDVNHVGKFKINRQEVRANQKSGKGNGRDDDNVSDAEVKAFKEYETAIVADKSAKAELVRTTKELDAAKKTGDAVKVAAAQKAESASAAAANDAAKALLATNRTWNEERDIAEPVSVPLFRASLLKCACVRQLFDPWFMDENTLDKSPPAPNLQRGASTSNERLHAHHLHITVADPKIL